MRLALVLVLTASGIVARAESEPVAADRLTVKAHVAVKVKSGSTGKAESYRS